MGSETVWKLLALLALNNNFYSYSGSMEVKNQCGRENNYMSSIFTLREYFDMFNKNAERPYSCCKHLNFTYYSTYSTSRRTSMSPSPSSTLTTVHVCAGPRGEGGLMVG